MSPADDHAQFEPAADRGWFDELSPEAQADHIAAVNEGIASADRGEFIPLEDILAWMDSWGTENPLPRPLAKPL